MAYKSLLSFIDKLEASGELIRIKNYVDPVLEITEITDRISKIPGGGKALLFENTGTDFPLLINSLGSERRICMALGVNNLDETGIKISALMNQLAISRNTFWTQLKMLPTLKELSSLFPLRKNRKGACQEVVMKEPDLSRLPVLKCWPQDGGRFITLPLVNTIDPISGIRNIGMYRMQVFNSNTTGMHWHRHKTGARHYELYKSLGKKMPVAVVLGGDPAYTYAATAPLPDNIDEYLFAGFLRGKRVELVKCLTQDIEVPSDADFVIEGYIDPDEMPAIEGPFGDHTGFYSLADRYPVFHVTCISHRKDAVYPATIVGVPPQEDAWIAKATERIFITPIRLALAPEIIDLNLPVEGTAHNLAIVKINKTYPGQAFKVMNALWGAGQMMFNKVMIVTGKETDIFSPMEVLRTIITNVTQSSHVSMQMGPADVLDHSARSFTYGGKLCIDATVKMNEELEIDFQNGQEAVPLYSSGLNHNAYDVPAILQSLDDLHSITNSNHSFLQEGMGLLILTINKIRKEMVRDLSKSLFNLPHFHGIKFMIFLDEPAPLHNLQFITWLVLSNTDPERDCFVFKENGGINIAVDATRKSRQFDGFQREWPAAIVSDDQTIKEIDIKWESLGLGEFITSPSILIKGQVLK